MHSKPGISRCMKRLLHLKKFCVTIFFAKLKAKFPLWRHNEIVLMTLFPLDFLLLSSDGWLLSDSIIPLSRSQRMYSFWQTCSAGTPFVTSRKWPSVDCHQKIIFTLEWLPIMIFAFMASSTMLPCQICLCFTLFPFSFWQEIVFHAKLSC